MRKLIFAAITTFVSTAVSATTFDLTDPVSRDIIKNNTYAGQYNYVVDDTVLSVTGWSYRGSRYGTHNINQTWVGLWSGLGVEKRHSSQHAIDNANGDYDMLLLAFDDAVSLDAISIGWMKKDSDVSILAYTGTEPFDNGLGSLSKWEEVLDNGWSGEPGAAADIPLNTYVDVNDGNIVSQYWLIGAFNESLNDGGVDLDEGNDFFKLSGVSIAHAIAEVPLPASVLFFGVGLFAFGCLRRNKHSRNQTQPSYLN